MTMFSEIGDFCVIVLLLLVLFCTEFSLSQDTFPVSSARPCLKSITELLQIPLLLSCIYSAGIPV